MRHTAWLDPKEETEITGREMLAALAFMTDIYRAEKSPPGLLVPVRILPNQGIRCHIWTVKTVKGYG